MTEKNSTQLRPRILLVDDERRVLSSTRRYLRQICPDVELELAESCAEAEALAGSLRFDLVITDIRMPQKDGTHLLRSLRRTHPETFRVILSGQADYDQLLDGLFSSHQYLEKPCSREGLFRLLSALEMIRDSAAPPALLRQLLTLNTLPCDGVFLESLERMLGERSELNDPVPPAWLDLGTCLGGMRLARVVFGEQRTDRGGEAYPITFALLAALRQSRLVDPYYGDDPFLAVLRTSTLRAVAAGRELSRRRADLCSWAIRLVSAASYAGELAILASVGADLELITRLLPFRAECSRILAQLWGFPTALCAQMEERAVIEAQARVEALFPYDDLFHLSNQQSLELFREVVCSTDL